MNKAVTAMAALCWHLLALPLALGVLAPGWRKSEAFARWRNGDMRERRRRRW